MLGLIAALTPVLYKHVADRRQDIENINEANTLLLLKNAAAEYIEANKDSITVGTTLLEPTDVGIDIEGYKIGIRKEDDGTINAMIAATDAGSDMKAAKVASLLGVSAGIYSAQDTAKAWGINGVWAEDVSNYGFTSLPTGVPVVTTTYDKENDAVLDMEEIFTEIENHEFAQLSTKKLCLSGECIDDWEAITLDPLEIIAACNNNTAWACEKGREHSFNHNCQQIADSYQKKGINAPNQIYTLTISPTANSTQRTFCWFKDGYGFSTEEILGANCSTAGNMACETGYLYEVNRSCQDIFDAFTVSELTKPSKGTYYLTTAATGIGVQRTCYFLNNKGWLGSEIITECNAATTGTCVAGYNNVLNRTCQNIYDTNKKDGITFVSGRYTLTKSASNFSVNQYCFCEGDTCYSAKDIIEKCNEGKGTYNNFCEIGYNQQINNSCERVVYYDDSFISEIIYITNPTTARETCCAEQIISGVTSYDELFKGEARILSSNIKTNLGAASNVATFDTLKICVGKYKIDLRGEGGTGCGSYTPSEGSGAGGIIHGTKSFAQDTVLNFKRIKGGYAPEHGGGEYSTGCMGGAGIGVWENDNTTPSLVVGGGGGGATGGGGYTGGKTDVYHSSNWNGRSWDGNIGYSTWQCTAVNCSYGAIGGRTINATHYGGTALCGSGYTCSQIPGGNGITTGTNYYNTSYGNLADGYASITYCGNNSSTCP
ncbi:MAG: hypothetical protein IKD08_06640 [Alphaproteobacteria bacterium]|nr:hypothetical protein [Alphaproteobacteria bacterium]